MDSNAPELVPVYLSFSTFQSAISSLRDHGLPNKIDRSAFTTRSGGEQSQILSAFKFLGLIGPNDETQDTLKALIKTKDGSPEQKKLLEQILRDRYAKVFKHDLTTATPRQVVDAIGEYGSTGTTKDRAVRFFLKTCEYAGIPLTKRLTEGTRVSRRGSTNSTTANDNSDPQPAKRRKRAIRPTGTASQTGSAIMTIHLLQANGDLTISGTFNAFDLEGDERSLVYEIIDRMKEYEKKHQ